MEEYFNEFPLGKEIWEKKYKDKTQDTDIYSTWKRVANAIGKNETQEVRDQFYHILSEGYFVPGGRITNGAGTKHNFLMNCSVRSVEDSLDEIYETIKKSAKMFKCNYGVGYSFHKLRPKDAKLSKGGKSSGVVSFMKVFDSSCAVIQSGGENRRGAQLGALPTSHPDIFDFIDAKHIDKELSNFNISVSIDKTFIDAVKNDSDYDLVWEGKVYRTVKAKDIWKKLCESGYKYNDPGILNLHEANKYNNLWYLDQFFATNPCGEIFLFPDEVCCLGSVNMTRFIIDPFTDKARFDLLKFKEVVAIATRFLDCVIDISDYPFDEIKNTVQSNRRIGLNVVGGLGSTLAMLKFPYDSVSGISWAEDMQQVGTAVAYTTSIELAKEKGSFKTFISDKFCDGEFIKKLEPEIQDGIRTHGIRNCALITIPPMGTGALLLGNISSGMEPIFSLEYERRVRQDDNSFKTEVVDDYSWRLYKSLGMPDGENPEYFKTARDINPIKHIDMQAALQTWVCNSISKTINIPADYSFEDYESLLWYAIEKGVKGTTSFREGTMEGILSTKNEKEKSSKEIKKEQKEFYDVWEGHEGDEIFDDVSLPEEYPCKGFTLKSEGKKWYIHTSFKDRKMTKPFALFVHTNNKESSLVTYTAIDKLEELATRKGIPEEHIVKNKQKCADQNNVNKLARTISLLLRHNVKIDKIVKVLDDIEEIPISSFLYRIKKFLGKYVIEVDTNEKCPECGDNLIFKEGCKGCKCGFSKC